MYYIVYNNSNLDSVMLRKFIILFTVFIITFLTGFVLLPYNIYICGILEIMAVISYGMIHWLIDTEARKQGLK